MLASLLILLGLLLLSALFSGSETGIYSVSRLQLDVESERGRWSARALRHLLRDDAGLLVTLLVGNNLMLELLTHEFEGVLPRGFPSWAREITVACLLTPVVFLFGELLPKDLFRRRPMRLLLMSSGLLVTARVVFWPVAWPIRGLWRLIERRSGVMSGELAVALRREEMVEVLQEGRRAGALTPRAEALARNVLVLRETPLAKVMIPWERVSTLDASLPVDELRDLAQRSDYSRLPAVGQVPAAEGLPAGDGPRVLGYVHLLDLLGEQLDVAECLRPLPTLSPDDPVDRALARLRMSGQRLALVGSPETPQGLVTLMDLVEAISRQSHS